MRLFRNSESGQMTLLGLGLLLLIIGIIILFFVFSPLGEQFFGMRGPHFRKYLIVGIVMVVVGLFLAQRGIRHV